MIELINDKFVQVAGPFTAKEDIVTWIQQNYDDEFKYIKKCGIQCPKTHEIVVNGNKIEMGKTEILEYSDVRITSLYFSQDESAEVLVDCILE